MIKMTTTLQEDKYDLNFLTIENLQKQISNI